MYWGLYQLIVVVAACATGAAWIIRPFRPVLAMAGAALWTIASLQARNITTYSGGSSFSAGSEAWQYVSLGLAILSLATVLLWHLDVYPPDEGSAGAAQFQGDAR